MKTLFKKSLCFLCLAIGITGLARSQNYVIVLLNNGIQKSIPLESMERMTFQDKNLQINSMTEGVLNYEIGSIQKLLFDVTVSGVTSLQKNLSAYSLSLHSGMDYFTVAPLPEEGAWIYICRTDGTMVKPLQHIYPGEQINIQELPTGIYLVKVNSQTLKFSKL